MRQEFLDRTDPAGVGAPTRRYDEFMHDVATAACRHSGMNSAEPDRVETFVDEKSARPAIMNSLRDRISSASQLAERSVSYPSGEVTSTIQGTLHGLHVFKRIAYSCRTSASWCVIATPSSVF